MNRRRLYILTLLLGPLIAPGCTCGGMASKPKVRRASETAKGNNARWNEAAIDIGISSQKVTPSGRQLPIPTTWYTVHIVLVLNGPAGERRLALGDERVTMSGDTAAADRQYLLQYASDGRGIAVSSEGSDLWQWVALDAQDPVFCPHFRGKEGPAARPLILDILQAKVEGGPHPDAMDFTESMMVTEFVVKSRDAELEAALARAATRPMAHFMVEMLTAAQRKGMQELAARSAEFRKVCHEALAVPDGAGRLSTGNAAILLELCEDEGSQAALAGAFVRGPPGNGVRGDAIDGNYQRNVARSLARVTETRKAAAPGVEEKVLACLEDEKDWDRYAKVYALRAAAAIGSEKCLAAIRKLAAAAQGDEPLWPKGFVEFVGTVMDQGMPNKFPIENFAKAALRK